MARPTRAKASLASPTRPSSETTSTPVNRALREASELWQGFGSAGAALRRRSEASLPPEPPSPAEPRPFSPSWAPCRPLRRGRRVEGVPRLCQTQLRPLSHAILARELLLPAEVEGADREAGGIGDGGLGTETWRSRRPSSTRPRSRCSDGSSSTWKRRWRSCAGSSRGWKGRRAPAARDHEGKKAVERRRPSRLLALPRRDRPGSLSCARRVLRRLSWIFFPPIHARNGVPRGCRCLVFLVRRCRDHARLV